MFSNPHLNELGQCLRKLAPNEKRIMAAFDFPQAKYNFKEKKREKFTYEWPFNLLLRRFHKLRSQFDCGFFFCVCFTLRVLTCLFPKVLRLCVAFCGPSRRRTFHSSFEEDFAAPTRHDAVMAPRCFVSTDQTHFGRGGRLSQRRAEKRHKRKS